MKDLKKVLNEIKAKKEIVAEISKNWVKKHFDIEQRDFFIDLLRELKPQYCLETGFETGTSSATVCAICQPKTMISIGMKSNNLTVADKLYRDYSFQLLIADSTKRLTEKFFKFNYPNGIDFFFVDGGHSYEVAMSDITSAFPYMNKGAVIVVDDYYSKICPIQDVNNAVNDFCNAYNLQMYQVSTNSGKGMAVIEF